MCDAPWLSRSLFVVSLRLMGMMMESCVAEDTPRSQKMKPHIDIEVGHRGDWMCVVVLTAKT